MYIFIIIIIINFFYSQVKSGGKILWLLIVLASLAVATIFLHASIQDFTSSTVVTTIATTTASLQEVRCCA